jgi:hypothetical protein
MPYPYIEVVKSENSEAVWRMSTEGMSEEQIRNYVADRYRKLDKSKFHIEPHISDIKLETGALYGESPDENEDEED